MLTLSLGINLGSSVEDNINNEQIENGKYESFSEAKDSSIICEQCKQNEIINTKQEVVTTQIHSEINEAIDNKNPIDLGEEEQNISTTQQENLLNNIQKTQLSAIPSYRKQLVQIVETNSLKQVWQELDKCHIIDENTLAVLDIDQTILKSEEITISPQYQEQWKRLEEVFETKYPQYVTLRDFYIDIFRKEHKEILTESIWKEFIHNLKSRGAKVLVVTAIMNDYLVNEDLEPTETMWVELRHKQLNDAIDNKEQTITNVFGENLPSSFWLKEKLKSPYYFNGILTTQPWTKDQALFELLSYWGKWGDWHPNKFIAIDDQDYNLANFTTLSLGTEMTFIGYKFTRANDIPYGYEFDPKRGFFQQMYLVKNKRWLNDEEADKMLKTCSDEEKQKLEELVKLYNEKQNSNKKNKKSKHCQQYS